MKKILLMLLCTACLHTNAQVYIISGILKNIEDEPISGAIVKLISLHDSNSVITNVSGRFKLYSKDLLLSDEIEIKDKKQNHSIRIQINEKMNGLDIDSGNIKIYKLSIVRKDESLLPFENNGNMIVKKPVIYLYPSKKETVSISVDFRGTFSTTYPAYKGKWVVEANPDGLLTDPVSGRNYYYLFWDGKIRYDSTHLNFSNGFIIESKNIFDFLQTKLTQLGLNYKEQNDFIVYWLPELQKHDLNFIHFRINEDYKYISKNSVTPSPNSQLRIMMEFKPVDKNVSVKPQSFPSFHRKGFTLVEWGGVELKDEIIINNEKM